MMIISFFLGQKHFKVPYKIGVIAGYIGFSGGLFLLSYFLAPENLTWRLLLNTFLLLIFVAAIAWFERDLLRRILHIKKTA
jgi:hypothetical protein